MAQNQAVGHDDRAEPLFRPEDFPYPFGSVPDGPEVQFKLGEVPGNMKGKTCGALQLSQVFGIGFEAEIGFVGMERNLPRRHGQRPDLDAKSEEHTSELQSLMRI